MEASVRQAVTAAERQAIQALRYAVSVEELGKPLAAADHTRRLLPDPHDAVASHFFAESGGEVVAALTLNCPAAGFDPDWIAQFGLDPEDAESRRVVIVSRLVVRADWRATGILGRLFLQAFDHARSQGHTRSYCLAAPGLVRLYEKMGYRCFRPSVHLPQIGLRVPLLLVLNDLAHLESVGSPFLRLLRRQGAAGADDWFGQHYPELDAFYRERASEQDAYWSAIAQRVEQRGETLFRGLGETEIRAFIEAATVLQLDAGQKLITAGDADQEMYYVLSGTVEVLKPVGADMVSLAAFGPGQVVGELAFLSRKSRSADVVAVERAEVLALTRSTLGKMALKMPAVVVRVALNLAELVGERLRHTTELHSQPPAA